MTLAGPGLAERWYGEFRMLGAWWVSQLAELVQAVLGRLVPRLATRLVVRCHATGYALRCGLGPDAPLLLGVESTSRAEAPDVIRSIQDVRERFGSQVTLIIPPTDILHLHVRIPSGVDRQVDDALALHLERELPVPMERVAVFRGPVHRPDRRATESTVEVWAARRDRIQALREQVEQAGWRVARIVALDSAGRVAGDFLTERATPGWRWWTLPDRWLLWSACALAALALLTSLGQWSVERVIVLRALDHARLDTVDISKQLEELKVTARRASSVRQAMAPPDAADLVELLSRSLPTEAWAHDIDLQVPAAGPAQLSLRGVASRSMSIEETLRSLPLTELSVSVHSVYTGEPAGNGFEVEATWVSPRPVHAQVSSVAASQP